MSFLITCDMCGEGLDEPGGILFGVPDRGDMCRKRHLCAECYPLVAEMIDAWPPDDQEEP